ncbi:hypothetical protein D3C75_839730 [compost metagenome]
MPPSISRSPRNTATTAVHKVANSSITKADINASRRVPMVALRCSSPMRAIIRICSRLRLKIRRVGSPRTTSWKWPLK